MAFELPPLPYPKEALEPHMSRETLEFHYGKHHNAYVTKLNELVGGTPDEGKPLVDIIRSASPGPLFNNAAQVWNHTFFWSCLSPNGGGQPSGELASAISRDFGSFDEFKKKFTDSAIGNFGSGWTWLVKKDGKLAIVNTSNAGTPITDTGAVPLLTCDVWEHAYYIDYRNARPKFLEAFWSLANWDFAAKNLASA